MILIWLRCITTLEKTKVGILYCMIGSEERLTIRNRESVNNTTVCNEKEKIEDMQ